MFFVVGSELLKNSNAFVNHHLNWITYNWICLPFSKWNIPRLNLNFGTLRFWKEGRIKVEAASKCWISVWSLILKMQFHGDIWSDFSVVPKSMFVSLFLVLISKDTQQRLKMGTFSMVISEMITIRYFHSHRSLDQAIWVGSSSLAKSVDPHCFLIHPRWIK
jgi:hypothetical protein